MVRESLIPQWWFLSATDLCFECSLEVTVQLTFPCSDFERVHKISPFLQGSYRFSCRQARDIGVLCLFPHPLCPAHGQGVGFLKIFLQSCLLSSLTVLIKTPVVSYLSFYNHSPTGLPGSFHFPLCCILSAKEFLKIALSLRQSLLRDRQWLPLTHQQILPISSHWLPPFPSSW